MRNKKKITVFGMGYVGLTLALTLAKKKFKVLKQGPVDPSGKV